LRGGEKKMNALGIVRKLDELGRITIPMEVRRTNNWPEGTPMEMFMTEDGILIRKYSKRKSDLHEIIEDLKGALAGGKVTDESLKKAIEALENKK
jgi:AbrB family looped-hinge helix DNA binding protein